MGLPVISRMKARAVWQSPSSKYVVWMKPFVQILINGKLEAAAPTAQGSVLPESMATGPMTSTGKLYQIVSDGTPLGLRAIWTGPPAQLYVFSAGGLAVGPAIHKGFDLTPYAAIAPTGGGTGGPVPSLAGVSESAEGTLGETNVTVEPPSTGMSAGAIAYGLIGTASMAASAYHGYKRNDSIGWALVWGLAGSVFPIITPVIAVAQGFGEKAKSSK